MFLELAIVAGVRLSPTKVTLFGGIPRDLWENKNAPCYIVTCYMLQ